MLENMPVKKEILEEMREKEQVNLVEAIAKHYNVPEETIKKELDEIADEVKMIFQEKEGKTLTTTDIVYSIAKLTNDTPSVRDLVQSVYLVQSLIQLGRLLYIDSLSKDEEELDALLEALDLRDKLLEGEFNMNVSVDEEGLSINIELPHKTIENLSKEIVRAYRDEKLKNSLFGPVLSLLGLTFLGTEGEKQ